MEKRGLVSLFQRLYFLCFLFASVRNGSAAGCANRPQIYKVELCQPGTGGEFGNMASFLGRYDIFGIAGLVQNCPST